MGSSERSLVSVKRTNSGTEEMPYASQSFIGRFQVYLIATEKASSHTGQNTCQLPALRIKHLGWVLPQNQ